jgi:hypothetical protein
MGAMADKLRLTLEDIYQYFVRVGLDVFPPLELASEQFRAQTLYRNLNETWPVLFSKLSLSASEFTVTGRFRAGATEAEAEVATFTYTPRGPVVTFPCKLAGADTLDYDDARCITEARAILDVVGRAFPLRETLRIGLIRDVVFSTGETKADNVLLPVANELDGARFVGGQTLLVYRDSFCNVRLTMAPLEIQRVQRAPTGVSRAEHAGFGLRLEFDVNNAELRPVSAADIEQVLQRALALWPETALDYLNRRARA